MTFGKTLANIVQMYTLLETSIGAVGRLEALSDDTPGDDGVGKNVVPHVSWPDRGGIEIRGVSASYRLVYYLMFCWFVWGLCI